MQIVAFLSYPSSAGETKYDTTSRACYSDHSPLSPIPARDSTKSPTSYTRLAAVRAWYILALFLRATPGSDYLPASTRTDHFTQTV